MNKSTIKRVNSSDSDYCNECSHASVFAMDANTIGHFNAELIATLASLQQRLDAVERQNQVLSQEIKSLIAERDELRKKVEVQAAEILYYKERLSVLQREVFWKKSERRELPRSVAQLLLLPGFDDANRPVAPEAKTETITYERKKPNAFNGTRKERTLRFPEQLRRQVVVIPPEEQCCLGCGEENLHEIRVEITEKLCCSRDPFYVKEYHRQVLSCRACETVAPMPPLPEVFERTAVDETVVANLIVNKCRYGIPLYRQGNQFRDIGIEFSNDALVTWFLRGIDLVMPIYLMLVETVLKCRYLIADDTRLRAAVGPVKKHLPQYKQGALWGLYGMEIDCVVYQFTNSRSHAGCREVLNGFQGYLIVDGYDGFDALGAKDGITQVHCNNHARRGFVRAETNDKKRAHEALAFYQALYRVEEETKGLSPPERRLKRQEQAGPIFDKFKEWLTVVGRAAPPKSPLGKACAYVLKRWQSLTVYLDDGYLPIDTMALERQFRAIAVGRKNFLHAASETGAHGAAAAYSLVNTCLLQDIDPFVYLSDVMARVSSCLQRDIHTLLPHNWKQQYLADAAARYASPFTNSLGAAA